MKAFVSGQLAEKEQIRTIYSKLEDMGMEVTHDWTNTDTLENYSKNSKEAGHRAKLDIDGVCHADMYILMTNNQLPGKGMYVELGAALALAQTTGSPEILIVGPKNHESIFYYHPLTKHFADIDSCLRYVREKYR